MADTTAKPAAGDAAELEERLSRGAELLREDQVEQAAAELRAAVDLSPKDERALGLLGLAYFRLSAFAEAREVYEHLVAIRDDDASYRLNLGLVHLKMERPTAAIAELRRSQELDPGHSRTVSYLGLAYARSGQYALAYESFLRAGQSALAAEMEQYLSEAEQRAISDRVAGDEALDADTEAEAASADAAAAEADAKVVELEAAPAEEAEAEVQPAAGAAAGAAEPDPAEAATGESAPEPEAAGAAEPEEPAPKAAAAEPHAAEVAGPAPKAAAAAESAAEPHAAEAGQPSPKAAVAAEPEPEPEPRAAEAAEAGAAAPAAVADAAAVPDAAGETRQDGAPAQATEGVITRAVAAAGPAILAAAVRTAAGHRPPQRLAELASAARIRPEDGDHPFAIAAGGALVTRVDGRVFARTQGVVVSSGELGFEAATRRVRGAQTSERLGGDEGLFAITGKGYLIAAPGKARFSALRLDDDILYVREELVFGFEEQLHWESGHVPGRGDRIRVVQFRGTGCLALRAPRPLLSLGLGPERVMYVDAEVLAGWIGRVIPRLVEPAAGGRSSTPFVECSGEGVVLIHDFSGPDGETRGSRETPE